MPLIVVTGGAGFIGSVLVWKLLARGEEVAVVDFPEAGPGNLDGAPLAARFEPEPFLAAFEAAAAPPCRAVIHLGACSSTLESDWDYLRRNNLEYSQRLARVCLDRGLPLVYASTAATYGDGAQGYTADLDALDRLRPLNLYARSKHEFDLWLRAHGGFAHAAGLKYFNVYGPNEYHKGPMRSMVLKAAAQVAAGEPIRLFASARPEYPDGGQLRDFLYVEDAVDLTLWCLDHHACGLFNVGAGVARCWNDLARAVFAAAGRDTGIEYVPMPAPIAAAYQYHTCADLASLRRAGCALAPRSLEAGIERYVRGFLLPQRRFFRA